MQDAAEFNHSATSRAAAQKCLLPSVKEDTTSPLPTQAILELSEDRQNSTAEAHQTAPDPEELPASTTASVVGDTNAPSSIESDKNELQDPQSAVTAAHGESDADQIPLSSTSVVLSPTSPPAVAPQIAHPDSAASQTDANILDSAMDMPVGQNPSQLHSTAGANQGAVSDAAMLASSHAVNGMETHEKGVRTAAAAAAAALAPEVDDVMWPALMRQEAEGGILLIEALKRSIQSGIDSTPDCQSNLMADIKTERCVLRHGTCGQ